MATDLSHSGAYAINPKDNADLDGTEIIPLSVVDAPSPTGYTDAAMLLSEFKIWVAAP